MVDNDEHVKAACDIYNRHYNCAQAVLCAFAGHTGLATNTALRLASSFGTGMGNLKDVCGALTGAFMVLGIVKGYIDPTRENKIQHAARVDRLIAAFQSEFGAIHCRALLLKNAAAGNEEEKPCLKFVREAAKILLRELENE